MTYKNIIVEISDAVATVTLNRPKVLNALNGETTSEIGDAMERLEADKRVRAIILTGAGDKAFAAGADIRELAELPDANAAADKSRVTHDVYLKIEAMGKPVIAALNGFALGGGCELALACDIRIASDSAVLGLPEITLGIIPGGGGTQRLPRLVPTGVAKKLIFSGDHIDAAEALRIGLVDEVVPAAELMGRAGALATKISTRAPMSLALAKQAINKGLECDLERGCALEVANFGLACATEDKAEGTRAFVEKRKPAFKGQ
jgi:enoyl-CoA hydratase